MEKGIWKKYGIVDFDSSGERSSYDELYDDLKNSGKTWEIACNHQICKYHLTGENEFWPGDIYVYYCEQNGKRIPEFYIKVMKTYDYKNKREKNFITFNGSSLGHDDIDDKYLPELIKKLHEIDSEKNAEFIVKLDQRYANYQRLLFLKDKQEYTEEELIFIYFMAYKENSQLALELLNGRNIQVDFDSLSNENKANLFVIVRDNQISNQLSITSKEVLLILAQKGSLKQLTNTTEEIIDDSDFIKELLTEFLKVKNVLNLHELEYHLPTKYQSDFNFLKLIIQYSEMSSFILWTWINSNQDLKQKMCNPDFAYEIMDTLTRTHINTNIYYPQYASFLTCFPSEALLDIENHLLIGPEPNQGREELKNEVLSLIQGEKKLILTRRELRREQKKS